MQVDTLIVGGGQAGIPLAHTLSDAGKRVALAERRHLGGSCVNFGCTPTKAAFASAELLRRARRAAEFGLRIPEVEVDLAAVLARARRIRDESRNGLRRGFSGPDAPTLLRGHARLLGRDGPLFAAEVGDVAVRARRVVLDTGTRSARPGIDGLDDIEFLHAGNWLDHDDLPARLIVLGGGYIGLELGQFYRTLGSRVVVVEGGAQIAEREDDDVAASLQDFLEDDGVEFVLGARACAVRRRGDGVELTLRQGGDLRRLRGSHLLVATGRTPNTDDLGLDRVGVELDEHGFVRVDERLATSVEGIWAAGDIRGGPMFTHTSYDDFRVLRSQLSGGSRTRERIVPYALFTDPQLGRVGMSEREARSAVGRIEVARYDFEKNGRAREMGETRGFVKVVVDPAEERLLGAAVLAADAAELVHSYIALMNADRSYRTLQEAVMIHPTLSEALQSVFKKLPESTGAS